MHPALSLPEILGHILQNLDQTDLASCTSVSRQFWEESSSLLWEDVTLADCAQLLPGVSCTEISTEGIGLVGLTIGLRGQRPTDKPVRLPPQICGVLQLNDALFYPSDITLTSNGSYNPRTGLGFKSTLPSLSAFDSKHL